MRQRRATLSKWHLPSSNQILIESENVILARKISKSTLGDLVALQMWFYSSVFKIRRQKHHRFFKRAIILVFLCSRLSESWSNHDETYNFLESVTSVFSRHAGCVCISLWVKLRLRFLFTQVCASCLLCDSTSCGFNFGDGRNYFYGLLAMILMCLWICLCLVRIPSVSTSRKQEVQFSIRA